MKRAISAHRANRDVCDQSSKRAKTGAGGDATAKQDFKATWSYLMLTLVSNPFFCRCRLPKLTKRFSKCGCSAIPGNQHRGSLWWCPMGSGALWVWSGVRRISIYINPKYIIQTTWYYPKWSWPVIFWDDKLSPTAKGSSNFSISTIMSWIPQTSFFFYWQCGAVLPGASLQWTEARRSLF